MNRSCKNAKIWWMACLITSMLVVLAGCSCGKKNGTNESSTAGNGTQGTQMEETSLAGTGTQGTSAHVTESSSHYDNTYETSTEEIGTSSNEGINHETNPEHGTSADAVGSATKDAIYKPGTYTGSAKGYGGTIEVTVQVDENHILSVEAKGDKETENIGQAAIKELAEKIKEANSTHIDAKSGATYSSQGLFEAVNDALAQAYTGEQ